MKNFKNLCFILAYFCLVSSCKKLIDPKPNDIADKMVGTYTLSEIIVNKQTLALPYKKGTDEFNGTIEIKKTDPTAIELTYTFNTVLKGVKETDSVEEYFFVKQGSKDIEIFEDETFNKQIGSLVDSKTLYLVSNDTDRITAIKK